MDIKKKHEKKIKKSIKYDDMEKCSIRETRKKPYQLLYLEKMRKNSIKSNPQRTCTFCNKEMTEGYVIDDGLEYFCSDDCLSSYYSVEEYDELCLMDRAYWTTWED